MTMPTEGWVCPFCQRVWAPFVRECDACNTKTEISTTKVWPSVDTGTTTCTQKIDYEMLDIS